MSKSPESKMFAIEKGNILAKANELSNSKVSHRQKFRTQGGRKLRPPLLRSFRTLGDLGGNRDTSIPRAHERART